MKRPRTLDRFETIVRFLLAIALTVIAWDAGTSVVAIGAAVLALIAIGSKRRLTDQPRVHPPRPTVIRTLHATSARRPPLTSSSSDPAR